MTEPECPQKAPFVLETDAGDHWWCACGRSRNQPFCDGSHKGTGIVPVRITLDEPKKAAWCGCKHTGTKPFCDGSHKKL